MIGRITEELLSLKDNSYKEFMQGLTPSVDPLFVIGIRTPVLRQMAKRYKNEEGIEDFLDDLPHKYFEENQLHAFIIADIKDFDECVSRVERFLPYVDNWATCDQMSPKVFKKRRQDLLPYIDRWLGSGKTYSVRFGIKMLMDHFLDDDFDVKYPEKVSKIRSEEYYVNMMIAWYFATALAKQYDEVIPFIEKKTLDSRTHNKAIQKSIESYRIDDIKKEYLRSLKIKNKR